MEGRVTRPLPTVPTAVLAAQAITLDAMTTDLARHAALNKGEYINAAERYARLALKAQSNSRATLWALTKRERGRPTRFICCRLWL